MTDDELVLTLNNVAGPAADQRITDAGGPDHEGGHCGLFPAAAHPHGSLSCPVSDIV